jgi:hypothetical protein
MYVCKLKDNKNNNNKKNQSIKSIIATKKQQQQQQSRWNSKRHTNHTYTLLEFVIDSYIFQYLFIKNQISIVSKSNRRKNKFLSSIVYLFLFVSFILYYYVIKCLRNEKWKHWETTHTHTQKRTHGRRHRSKRERERAPQQHQHQTLETQNKKERPHAMMVWVWLLSYICKIEF